MICIGTRLQALKDVKCPLAIGLQFQAAVVENVTDHRTDAWRTLSLRGKHSLSTLQMRQARL